ncbi:PorT family protein [Haoranjiania flava]|uniref:PorT family protein n=1 Tax=Haoranjiania flava TaxID=1856322 RepID=A0AAE3LMH0_9BACT|nr:PorT family protein [Haoranjiania flava]MCU7693866.1 PorT family protein [Haoranjiania flava]
MKRILVSIAAIFIATINLNAQTETTTQDTVSADVTAAIQDNARERRRDDRQPNVDLSKRANDHLMIQFGYLGWMGANGLEQPASKFNREFNIAFMYDKPFKANPNFSVGLGVGYSAGNVFFNNVSLGLKEPPVTNGKLAFKDVSNEIHFRKYKMVTQYVEAPLELRYASNAEEPAKGFRVAVGMKFGYLMKVHTKGKDLYDPSKATEQNKYPSVYGKNYIQKEVAGDNYLNQTRFTGTLRVGYNIVNVFGTYQLNSLFKTGVTNSNIHPFSIGLGLGIL